MDTGTPDMATVEGAVKAMIRRISQEARGQEESVPTRIRDCHSRALGEAAIRLLGTMPPSLRMVALRGQFPRVMNRIADAWDCPRTFSALIDSLILDSRGQRQGFPFEVMIEITELREYYFSMVHPEARPGTGAPGFRSHR